MANVIMTLDEALARPQKVNLKLIKATTEEDIIRHMFEDGEISEVEMKAMIVEERRSQKIAA